MKILISTQYRENYGSESDPYWKFKGGSEYIIEGVDPLRVAPGLLVDQVKSQIEYANPMSEEYILDWELVDDNYMTDFERGQLEYEGKITYPAKILEIVA